MRHLHVHLQVAPEYRSWPVPAHALYKRLVHVMPQEGKPEPSTAEHHATEIALSTAKHLGVPPAVCPQLTDFRFGCLD